jgi:hypothetical protein
VNLIIWTVMFLLLFLALNVLTGLGRKLKGGSFVPEPSSDEDRHIRDRSGRWWREEPKTGILEEAFRRPAGAPIVTPFVRNAAFSYLKFIMLIFGVLLVLSLIAHSLGIMK